MPVEPSDAEREYFNAREQEQRRELRARLERQARDLEEHRKVAESISTTDEALASRIHALGFDGDSARVFDLLPLVHVAWADGSVQRAERAAILRLVEQRGCAPGSEAFRLMESLLEERPSEAYMHESLDLLRDLTGGLGDRTTAIVDLCIEVAASSGGFLGLGQRIGDEERQRIGEIVQRLGSPAAEQFKQELAAPQTR